MKAITLTISTLSHLATALKAPWEIPLFPATPGDDPISIRRMQMSPNPQAMTPLRVTDNVVSLTRKLTKSRSSKISNAVREQANAAAGGVSRLQNGTAPMIQAEAGTIYLAPVTVGGQEFDVILDTGSSDPWLITSNFTCINLGNMSVQSSGACYFGPAYNSSQSKSYKALPDENMNVSYTDGEFLTGSVGFDTFTMANITVPKQEFGLINYAGWQGDGQSSGLIGFAYSTITSAYNGTDPDDDQKGHAVTYNTLFTNMWNDSLVAPVFSLALSRDPNEGGLVALGGIPGIPHTPIWISTPIQSVGVFPNTTKPAYEYYTIYIDGFALSSDPGAQFGPVTGTDPLKTPLQENGTVIVDSGTSLLYAPDDVAAAFAAAFIPPATNDSVGGLYNVACNGTPPTFGVSIGQKVFYVNPADLIIQTGLGPDACLSGVQGSGSGLNILGDVWMKNVLVVHDIGAEMMRFAAREFFALTLDPVVPPS